MFRQDRHLCNCDLYDMPHRFTDRCEAGHDTATILIGQGKEIRQPVKKEVVTGWRCPAVDSDGNICGSVNPFTTVKCLECGK